MSNDNKISFSRITGKIGVTQLPDWLRKVYQAPEDENAVDKIAELNGASHTQNTDTKLANGTSDEVTASELRAHVDDTSIHTERAQIMAINWFNS